MRIYWNKIENIFKKLEIYNEIGIIIKLDKMNRINSLIKFLWNSIFNLKFVQEKFNQAYNN